MIGLSWGGEPRAFKLIAEWFTKPITITDKLFRVGGEDFKYLMQ